MNCEIIPINESTWRIENGGVRYFLLCGAERAALVDTGMRAPDAREIADLLRGNLCGFKNTSCADQLSKAIDRALEA